MTGNRTPTTPGPLPRPTLLPGLRRLWRDRHRLQLGVDPAGAIVLELPDPTAAALLDLLDGSRSERMVLAAAGRSGIREHEARALLDTLRRAGLVVGAHTLFPHNLPEPVRQRLGGEAAALALRGGATAPGTPAQILRRRAAARVVVTGHGPLAAPLALVLAQAGVGHVAPKIERAPAIASAAPDPAAAVVSPAVAAAPDPAAPNPAAAGPAAPDPAAGGPGGRRPNDEIAEAIARVAPDTRTWPLRRRDTSFVVQVGAPGPANLTAAGYAQHKLAHLAVSVRDGTAVIGPLVPPAGGPCLNCVDLHRRDRDPQWPELAAQLAQPASDPCAAATVLCAAGVAAGEVLSWLDGETPATLGASLEITRPGQLRRRSWPPHPNCPCHRRHLRTRPGP